MIRPATELDLDELTDLAEAFITEGHYAGHMPVNRKTLRPYMANLVALGPTAVLIEDISGKIAGMVGLQVVDHPMSGERVAGELFWYVRPEHRNGVGRQLMKAAEDWALKHNARKIQMTAPDDRVAKVYERSGFKRIETTYQKELT